MFKIICGICGNVVDIKTTTDTEFIKSQDMEILSTTTQTIIIQCKCGYSAYIEQ